MPLPSISGDINSLMSGNSLGTGLLGSTAQSYLDQNRIYSPSGQDFVTQEMTRKANSVAGAQAMASQLYQSAATHIQALQGIEGQLAMEGHIQGCSRRAPLSVAYSLCYFCNGALMIDKSIADEVRRRRLTYVEPAKFDSLYDCIDKVQVSQIPGDFVEFGVALGGSGICLAKALTAGRRYLGFDVFGMIPPPSAADGEEVHARYKIIASGRSAGIDGDQYYGYVDNLYDVVKNNFRSFGCDVDNKQIILVKGLFHETLPLHNEISIALAHIDCDWYEPVLYCLNYVWPNLATGGFVVVDDYTAWSGCKKATDEFVSSHKAAEPIRYSPHAVLQKPPEAGV